MSFAILDPIRAVAALTGISLDTLRAWERRYQAVTPERGTRGRLSSDADIRRLLLLKEAVENGYAVGQVASLSDSLLKESLGGPRPAGCQPGKEGPARWIGFRNP